MYHLVRLLMLKEAFSAGLSITFIIILVFHGSMEESMTLLPL
jgi:hypothetical protein